MTDKELLTAYRQEMHKIQIKNGFTDEQMTSYRQGFMDAIREYEQRIAADVQPVIHSRWIPTGDGTYNAYCENCGQERGSKSWNKNDFKYCFGCGARMNGDTNA